MAVSKSKMLEIAATIKSNVIIDDHTGAETTVAAIALLSIGDNRHHIVPIFNNTSHCLNSLNNAGGEWRQTKWSVSGMMDTRDVSIEEAVKYFNRSYSEGDMSGDIHQLTIVKEF